ncbi:MAG TPA: SpvB/TcaC N-terminal domain-containing protein, partial [Thermoanaerobaculia bacterium]|nr:SpvB/TcaC N-terminal domain-containing protein [Thermoanaerobaculia bacterium]
MKHRRRVGAVAFALVLLSVGWIFGQPGGPVPTRGDDVLQRVVPLRVDLLPAGEGSPPGGDPWRLFDRDPESGLAGPGEEPARVRLRLDRARAIAALGVYGPADGHLKVLARRGADWVSLHELDLRALAPGWHRTNLAEPFVARALLVEWQPFSSGAVLPEIELWSSEGAAFPPSESRRTATALPGEAGTFLIQLDEDPKAFSRAFLIYELEGLPHWTAARRSINGLPPQGGFAPAASKGFSSQTEEINPRWLRRGDNEVRFLPVKAEEDLPYRVRNLRIALAEEGGRPLLAEPSPLADGRLDTGWDGQDHPAVDLPFRTPFQPYALELALTGRPSGELLAEALLRDGTAVSIGAPIDLEALAPGRHRIALDGPPETLGLRLTWSGAGKGEIAEAGVLGSPTVSPRLRRPVLTLTHPAAGEDTEAGAYLRGFFEPVDGAAGRPELSVDGAPAAKAVERDGAFGLFVPRTGPPGEPWKVVLKATFSDGTRLRKVVRFGGRGGDRDLDSDLENLKEELAGPGEAKTLKLGGARLDVPLGALAQKVALSMRRLAGDDLPELDAGMTNVTAEGGGLRMGPHGLRFRAPVQLTLPYDASRIPPGMTDDDIQTYYFDESAGRWFPVPRVEINAGARWIVSATDHFTDFIAATLALPEEPAGESLTPNSLDELATADPASEITLIEPPEAGPAGTANLSFPLTVPPGRQGLQPDLAVSYSSGPANGWLGVGWDLPLPAIEVSTLFGVPRYDPAHETETYLLDGQQLAPVASPATPRAAERVFTRRVEGGFERIVRHGSKPTDFWWEVTDKSGVHFIYGRNEQARLSSRTPILPKNIFRWHLEQVVDPHGNTVDYTYRTDKSESGASGEPWVQIYPESISYTGSPQGGAQYRVDFNFEDGRPDLQSTGQPGFKVVTRQRLQSVDVLARGARVRRYAFFYRTENLAAGFFKSLLTSIAVLGEDGETELYRHSFEYFERELEENRFAGFSAPETWSGMRSGKDATDTMSWSVGGHAFAGLGPPGCQPHVGVQVGGADGGSEVQASFFDVDGDGLPDRIDEDGNVDRNRYDLKTDRGSFSPTRFGGADLFGSSTDWNIDVGTGVHAEMGFQAALDSSFTWAFSSDDRAVADVNGDGRADLVSTEDGFSVRINTGQGFEERSSWGGFGGVDLSVPGQEEEILSKFKLADTVRQLRLPYTGRVEITGAVRRKEAGGDGVKAWIFHNNSPYWQRTIAADDLSACEPGNPLNPCGGGFQIDVVAGDKLYFVTSSIRDTSADDLLWSPRVAYVGGDPEALEPWGTHPNVFDAGEDFRLAGFFGAGWTAPVDGTVRILGGLAKQTTSDDVGVGIWMVRSLTDIEFFYTRTLGASETGTFDDFPSIQVKAGETLRFAVRSDTPVDPTRVTWTPTVTYEGGELCKPLLEGGQHCGAVTCGPETCDLAGDPEPETPVERELVAQPAQVSHFVPALDSFGQTPWRAPKAGRYELEFAWNASGSPGRGPVLLYVQGLHQLYAKHVVEEDKKKAAFSLSLDLAAGDPVFVSVVPQWKIDPIYLLLAPDRAHDYGSAKAVMVEPPNPEDPIPVPRFHALPVNLLLPDPAAADEVLSGGWHGWRYGEWNGNLPFQPFLLIRPPAPEKGDKAQDELPYTPAVPRWQGAEGIDEPLWTAAGFDLRFAAGSMKPSRRGKNVTEKLDSQATGAKSAGGELGVLRQTVGRTESYGISGGVTRGIGVGSGSLSLSSGSTDAQLDLLDMNGDGFVDQVSIGGVRFSNRVDGFGPLEPVPGLGDAVRTVDDATVGTTAGLGLNFVKKSGKGKPRSTLNTMPSVGASMSLSQTRTDLLDVNGDGLPDRVTMTPGDSTLLVQLNLGYRFGLPESWPLPSWNNGGAGRCEDKEIVTYVASEIGGALFDNDTLDGISVTRSSAAHAGISIGPIGGGVVTTLARTLVDLADVNGDGLLDRVAKDQDDSYFRVQLNLGNGWAAAEEHWEAPAWTVAPGRGYDPGVFTCLDAVSFQGNLGGNGSVGVPFCIPLVVAGLQIEVSVQASGSDGGLQLSLQDLDGDGLADHVLKAGGDPNVYVRRNQARKVNLLSKVHRPLGGTITLDYIRQGNHANMPHSQWVLASSTIDDGRGNSYETSFQYDNDGFYDRVERESYGYHRIVTRRPDGSTAERLYHNKDFYRRYLLAEETAFDASGRRLVKNKNVYELAAVGSGSGFPKLAREETEIYEGETTPQKTAVKTYTYDLQGNVLEYRDSADEGSADDLVAAVTYVTPADGIVRPGSIEVRDGTGRLMRRRTATYNGSGDLTRLAQTLAGGKDPSNGSSYTEADIAAWDYTYDELGNLASSVDPTGYKREFTYDPEALTYPYELSDSFGYASRQTWDLRFGKLKKTVDPSGASLNLVYDTFGRLSEVYGPEDPAGSPALGFQYNPGARPAFAISHHKDVTRPDPIDTVVFLDGLGRTIQTKNDTEIDAGSGTATQVGMRVSGPLVFDTLGRVESEGQPFFNTEAADQFINATPVNKTTFQRDGLDRVTRVTFPHSVETLFNYGFATLDGVLRSTITRTDPNGRGTLFYYDLDGQVVGVEQTNRTKKLVTRYAYDAMSQLTAVTDVKGNVTRLEWDTLGQNVVLDSPDAGRTEMRYDRGGNLGARITANLAARGQQVRYLYKLNRLERIDYPQSPDVVYTYGAPGAPAFRAGRLATVTDESGTEELFYDPLGQVVRRTKTATALNGGSPKGPFTTTSRFDGFGRLLAVGYPDGEVVTYGFDAEGRVKSAAGVARGIRTDYLTHLGYDVEGDRVRALYGNGVETRWTYDSKSRDLIRLTTLERGGRELQDLVLTLDKAGSLLGLVNDVPVPAPPQYGGPTSQSFRYDDLYQLVGADGTYQSAPNKRSTYSLALAYDDLGNVTGKKQLHQVTSGNKPNTEKKTSYDQAYTYGGPRPHAPTRIGSRAFQYDLNGNPTGWQEDANGTRRTLTWNEENRLSAVADNGQTTRFLYDSEGTRTNKAGPHGETIYVDPYFTVRNGETGNRHVWVDGVRVATRVVPDVNDPLSWKLYFYQTDQLGSTQFVTDDRGLAWQHLEYFPSGETWVDERSEKQRTPWQFSGKEMDEETGLNYFGFRYYDARQSQWINPDP